MAGFRLRSDFAPTGDQPAAITALVAGLQAGAAHQVLLGVTGSGKTFTLANVIAQVDRPTLVIAPNKTLAAQLFQEFREFFPDNAVEYFVSYYDYYQPEAYVAATDTYIEKEATINDEIDRLRHAATRSLFERRDVIIVASVSCIYGLGSAEAYYGQLVFLEVGRKVDRDAVLRKLVDIQYERHDRDFHRGTFRVRGDVVEIFPAHEEERAIRVVWFDDEIEEVAEVDPLRGVVTRSLPRVAIYPNSHYVTTPDILGRANESIRNELREALQTFRATGKLLEAQRLEQRTQLDLEMLEQTGHCNGIENYSRHLTGRPPGEPPPCLIDFFPRDFLLLVDESHVTVPQVGGMFRGDRARKQNLVDFGFRLPSALDNRPLTFAEFEQRVFQTIYASATPGDYELGKAQDRVVEQIIRPTGLVDPPVVVRPVAGQVDDLLAEIRTTTARGDRTLVTTLTKRMAEDLTEYYADLGVRVRYLHSDIDTLERTRLLYDLRAGAFDVLVGINLLREGLDLPEVGLVAILDADKEGFLRSTRSLIQTIGRAARNVAGQVIMYADTMTAALTTALAETERRRALQAEYNAAHGIVPRSTERRLSEITTPAEPVATLAADAVTGRGRRGRTTAGRAPTPTAAFTRPEDIAREVARLTTEMRAAADALEFERAATLRDEIARLRKLELALR